MMGFSEKLPAALDKSGNAFAGVERKVEQQRKNNDKMLLVKDKIKKMLPLIKMILCMWKATGEKRKYI